MELEWMKDPVRLPVAQAVVTPGGPVLGQACPACRENFICGEDLAVLGLCTEALVPFHWECLFGEEG